MFRTSQFSFSDLIRPLRKIGISAGTSVIDRSATPDQGKRLGPRQRVEQLPFAAREGEDRQERDDRDQDREEDRPADRPAGLDDDLGRVAGDPLAAELAAQVVSGVLAHDDRLVDQDADRDRDPRQAHDVGRHPEEPHQQEAEQDRHRQRHGDHERIAQVAHHQHDGDRADDQLFLDRAADGLDRLVNQRRAVVERNDSHARRAAPSEGW